MMHQHHKSKAISVNYGYDWNYATNVPSIQCLQQTFQATNIRTNLPQQMKPGLCNMQMTTSEYHFAAELYGMQGGHTH
jgi:hypothetical protein